MEKINSEIMLRTAILQLESKQADEGTLMKEQFHLAYESIKPINIIKSTLIEAASSEDLRENIVNTSMGLTAGYLSKKLFEDVSDSPLKKLIGTALLFGITNAVAKNPEAVKAVGKGLLNWIRSRPEDGFNRATGKES